VGLLPLEAWVVVGERLMSPLDLPPLALALANRCGWRLDLGGFGVWIFWIQEMWCLWTISCQREVDCCLCNAVVVWLGSLGGRSDMMLL
jgi:hypothetical protein